MELIAYSYLLLFVLVGIVIFFLGRALENRMERDARRYVRLLVIIPRSRHGNGLGRDKHEFECSVDLYKRLGELRIPFALESVVHGLGEEIHFYLCVTKRHMKAAERLVLSFWPSAYIAEAEEHELWISSEAAGGIAIAAGYLTQTSPYLLPLKTAIKGSFEPFFGLLQHLSSLAAIGEGAAVQWIVRPADPRITADVGKHLQALQSGSYHPSKHLHEKFVATPDSLKILAQKAASPLFAVNARIVIAGPQKSAEEILARLASHFATSSVAGSQYNSLTVVSAKKNTERLLDAFTARSFEPAQEMILTAEEVATYFHFPGNNTTAPKIRR